jgi:UDP-3-O-[3-hydroxymyristoyl] glucosamine N-acyltransferase
MAKSLSKIIVGTQPWVGWAAAEWAAAAPDTRLVTLELQPNEHHHFDFASLEKYDPRTTTAFVACDDEFLTLHRKRLIEGLKKLGFALPSLIDRQALIAGDVEIPDNAWLRKGVIIGAGVRLETGVFADLGALINSASTISAYATLREGASLGAQCKIGARATIGAGVRLEKDTEVSAQSRLLKPGVYKGKYAEIVFIEDRFEAAII